MLGRAASYWLVRTARARGAASHRTLIVGTQRAADQIAGVLRAHREYGLLPVGFLDGSDEGDPVAGARRQALPLLGSVDQLPRVAADTGVRVVVVGSSSLSELDLLEQVRYWNRLQCDVFVVPRLIEAHGLGRDCESIWGIPLVRLRRASYRTLEWRLKRAVDVIASVFALAAAAPVMVVVAALVRLEGGRGVLFRQERIGVGGTTFELLKFRSLRPGRRG